MKTSNAISLDYEGIEVKFTEDAWFNATSAAERFGKRPNDWFSLPSTKEYIEAVGEMFNYQKIWYLSTSRGKNGGTWIHPKLAVAFARWLDVRFAIWCDEQIYSLLKGTHPYSNPPRDVLKKEKREAHHVMMDAKRFVIEDILGLKSSNGDFIKENYFCNRALTGKWEALEESLLDNYDLKLLKAIRNRNAVLIPHYLNQNEPGADGRTRKELLDQFVADYRKKHPKPSLVVDNTKKPDMLPAPVYDEEL